MQLGDEGLPPKLCQIEPTKRGLRIGFCAGTHSSFLFHSILDSSCPRLYIYICAIQLHIYVRGYISGWVETFQTSFLGLPPSSASDWSFVLDRITTQNFQLSHVSVAIVHPPPPASPWPVGSSNALDIFSRIRCFVSLFAYCRTHSFGWSNRSVEAEFCALSTPGGPSATLIPMVGVPVR